MQPRELGQVDLPAAWLLPDFSPGLWGEASLGPVTKWKEWGSVRASQSGAQELCAPVDCAAPRPELPGALLHLFLLPGNCFPCPTASGELLTQFPSRGPSSVWSTTGTVRNGGAAIYSPAGFWGHPRWREKFQRAAAVSCSSELPPRSRLQG